MTVERSSMNMQIRNISSISSVYSFVIEEWNRYRILLLKELVQLAGITGDALWNDIFQSNLFHSLFLFDPYSTILQLVSDQLERIMMVVHILILQDRFVNTVHFHIEMVLFLMQAYTNENRDGIHRTTNWCDLQSYPCIHIDVCENSNNPRKIAARRGWCERGGQYTLWYSSESLESWDNLVFNCRIWLSISLTEDWVGADGFRFRVERMDWISSRRL